MSARQRIVGVRACLTGLLLLVACGGTSKRTLDDGATGRGGNGAGAGGGRGASSGSGGSGALAGSAGTFTAPGLCTLECPAVRPQTGSPCGNCEGYCEYDDCSPSGGSDVEAQCSTGSWLVIDAGDCIHCCTSDTDCNGTQCIEGRCLWPTDSTEDCMLDVECGDFYFCAGVHPCACGTNGHDCLGDEPGACVPISMGCCVTDDNCGVEQECVAGTCKDIPGGDSCWTNADCDVVCVAPRSCPCGTMCRDDGQPGQCAVPAPL